uniref:Cytochrome c oxidase subunit 3 n=1 Tax=Schizopera knabeni TaxID=1432316 RepID=W8DNB9_9MAXI|nr:cytochrome c oxidase subunit III [Schizopera knabeni]
MSNLIRHPYHLVDESPWPLVATAGAFFLTTGLLEWFHYRSPSLMALGLGVIMLTMVQWWRDVSHEGASQGLHSALVELGLRYGMVLFITSEVLFFVSFFWAFFHSSLAPTVELGANWPPAGVVPFNPLEVPLLNTIVLLSSGVSVTWAHHALMSGDHHSALIGTLTTVSLGVYFTALQALEYWEASFSISDSVYGTTFFVATGFHGLHVIVGTLFLLVCAIRLFNGHFSASHHFGFEAAAWYWHFVDIVWLFLYAVVYWWGGI